MSGDQSRVENLRRLLAPRQLAMVGGESAAEAIRQCRRIGFTGQIWPVNPRRETIEGFRCYPDVASLPDAPDAAFVATPREPTVEIVEQLAELGTGGAVCHAAGFAEEGDHGEWLQQRLCDTAGEMAVIGPNCIGVLNYLDGAALWADQHGGRRVRNGVGLITQSGNIAQNLTMQRRSLPVAQVVTAGNAVVTGTADLIEAMLTDTRITAIGLHLEGIGDVEAFARAALKALHRGVPIVALKTGSSDLGAQMNLSHTSSLAGSDVLCEALFDRLGIARVEGVTSFVETLKFLHVHGPLTGVRISSASCSGGEAALIADTAQEGGLEFPELPEATRSRLRAVLGERVHLANPLDYHTYVWGDEASLDACFTALLDAGFDTNLLLLDFPRKDRADPGKWGITLDAFASARRRTGACCCVVSSLPESMPEDVGDRLIGEGIAPMQGIVDCVRAIRAAGEIGAAQRRSAQISPPDTPAGVLATEVLDERAGKQELAQWGVPVPEGQATSRDDAAQVAAELGFPVVAKAVEASITHKSEAGAVHVGLNDIGAVRTAVDAMAPLSRTFLIERMISDAVAELIVGVRRDPQYGLALTIGVGGVLVELLQDSSTMLLPVTRDEVEQALSRLRIWPVLCGYRSRVAGDVAATVDAIISIAEYARTNDVVELDVNPLLVLPDGAGAVAVDALVQRAKPGEHAGHYR